MDGSHFDSLTRILITPLSRRGTLGSLAAGVLLSLGLALDDTTVQAKKKRKRKRKKRNTQNPSAVCPPVCPLCQGCDGATGACVVHPSLQGQTAPGCDTPKLCCSGTCCDPIHACNSAGACATCAEVCPDTCFYCVSLADGGTACGDSLTCTTSAPPCTSTADCPAGRQCATSYTIRSTNRTFQECQPVGTGVCYSIGPCS